MTERYANASALRKVLSVLLALVLALGMIPIFPREAHAASSHVLTWPAPGNYKLTACCYGNKGTYCRSHNALDIDGRTGDRIVAAYGGTVDKVTPKKDGGEMGNYVRLKHKIDGKIYYTWYVHLDSYSVYKGQSVSAGQTIGKMGNTGTGNEGTTGDHLDFKLSITQWTDSAIDPSNWFAKLNATVARQSGFGSSCCTAAANRINNSPSPKPTCATPSIASKDVIGGKQISISTSTPGATLRYTTDGKTNPGKGNDSLYTGSFLDTWYTMGVRAIAMKSGYNNSAVKGETFYLSRVADPKINVNSGATGTFVTLATSTAGAKIYYTLDGSQPSVSNGKRYSGAISLDSNATLRCIAVKEGMKNSAEASKAIEVFPPKAPVASVAESNIPVGDPVQLTWKSDKSVAEYTATLYRDGEVVDTVKTEGAAASFILSEAGRYEVTVKGKNAVGEGNPCEPITVEAMNPCTVRFVDKVEGEDGEVTYTLLDEQEVKYGQSALKPSTPKKTGYSFSGWSKSFDKVTSDMQIEAEWDINTYVVQFYAEDGVTRLSRQVVEYGSAAEAPDPGAGNPGYRFSGWSVMSADDDSARDYKCVDSDMKLRAVYAWDYDNVSYINTEITNATRTAEGIYTVDVKMTNNPDNACVSTLLVSLKTSDGKLVQSSRQTVAFLAGSEHTETVTLKYSGNYVATVAEAELLGVDGNYRTGGGYSKAATSSIVSTDDFSYTNWSEWSTAKPEESEDTETEQSVQYRYRDKMTTTSSATSLAGWTRDGTESVVYSAWEGPVWRTGTKPTESDTLDIELDAIDHVWYYHYCSTYDGKLQTDSCWINSTSQWHTVDSDRLFPFITGFQDQGGKGSSASRDTGGLKCPNGKTTWWQLRYTVKWLCYTRTKTNMYGYWKWGDYSSWSNDEVAPSANRQVEAQDVYRTRTKVPNLVAGEEDASGTRYTVKGKLDVASDFEGATATVLVYNATNTDPTEDQIQYIGQIGIGPDASYDFSFVPKTDPTAQTGDFIVALAIEGASGLVNIDTIKAPRAQYKVTYQYADADGATHVVSEQMVEEGKNAQVPESPELEGYRFAGWSDSGARVNSDLVINAVFTPETYSVAWVDWASGKISTVKQSYGDELVPPFGDLEADGMEFKGWDALLEGKTTVTGDMVINAVYDAKYHKVTFLDKEGNAFDVQDVKHGESAVVPESSPSCEDMIFLGWETSEEAPWWNVEDDISVKPIFVYSETVESPVGYLNVEENEGLVGADGVTVSFESSTDGAQIFYTLDGSDPTTESERYDAAEGVVVKEPTLVRAIACKEGMNDSSVTDMPTNVTATNDLANAEMTAEALDLFSSEPVEASVGLNIGETQLEEGVDYRVTYEGNDKAGTATATAVGIGAYEGSKSCDFEIQAYSPDLYYGENPSGYAANMHIHMLGQELPDNESVEALAETLMSGVAAKDAVKQMASSTDFVNRDLNRKDTVTAICNVLLGVGGASDDDVSTWAGQLLAGSSVSDVIDAISATDAYVAQCERYGVFAQDNTQKPELIAKADVNQVQLGGRATFTCEVEGSDGSDVSYRWQQSANGGSTWRDCAVIGSSSKAMSYIYSEARSGYLFRCVVTASDGRSATTDPIGFKSAEPEAPLTASASVEPVDPGERATFTCEVEGSEGSDVAYKWQQSANGGSTWRDCAVIGSSSKAMSYIYSEARSGYLFRCVVTASDGRSATTDPIGFEVKVDALAVNEPSDSVDDGAAAVPEVEESGEGLASAGVLDEMGTQGDEGEPLQNEPQGVASGDPEDDQADISVDDGLGAQADANATLAEGVCGECAWLLTSDGVLTIASSGGGTLDPSAWGWSEGGLSEGAWRSSDIRHLVVRVVFVGNVVAGPHLDSMFEGCANLSDIDATGLDTSACESASGMFAGTLLEGIRDESEFIGIA